MMLNIGIYINNSITQNFVDSIIKFLQSKHEVVCPHIFSDDYIVSYFDLACLPSFYMYFYNKSILFTNLNDFLANRYDILSKDIYVITNINELKEHYLTPQNLNGIKLLQIINGEINEI